MPIAAAEPPLPYARPPTAQANVRRLTHTPRAGCREPGDKPMPGTFESDTGGTFNPLPADVHFTLRKNVDLPLPKGKMMHVPKAKLVGMLRNMY